MAAYWSLQTLEAWEEAIKLGYLEGSESLAAYPDEYKWMIGQMQKRLDSYKGEYPIWLWTVKPDMRSTGHFGSYTKCVRLKIELDANMVLLSDFIDWHSVLNDGFNADNEKEYEDYYNGKLNVSKEESWERIFDFNRVRDPEWVGDERIFQGVTGRVLLEKIVKVEHFVTRKQGKL
jgi:hypothetical protein